MRLRDACWRGAPMPRLTATEESWVNRMSWPMPRLYARAAQRDILLQLASEKNPLHLNGTMNWRQAQGENLLALLPGSVFAYMIAVNPFMNMRNILTQVCAYYGLVFLAVLLFVAAPVIIRWILRMREGDEQQLQLGAGWGS